MTVHLIPPLPPCPTCQEVPHGFTADFAPTELINDGTTEGRPVNQRQPEAATVTMTPCEHEHRGADARDLYRQILTSQEPK
jgi:hypothetical protein